jgi:hypothetical protein
VRAFGTTSLITPNSALNVIPELRKVNYDARTIKNHIRKQPAGKRTKDTVQPESQTMQARRPGSSAGHPRAISPPVISFTDKRSVPCG